MENKDNSIFTFLTQTFVLFGIDILILSLFTVLIGEGAKDLSTIYQLGSRGLAVPTLLQFLLSAATVAALRAFFFSDKIFKKLMAIWRTTIMLICILITHIGFIIIFHWFSYDNYYAWISFMACFIGGFVFGLLFMILKTRVENRQYDELLSQYKNEHEGDDENE